MSASLNGHSARAYVADYYSWTLPRQFKSCFSSSRRSWDGILFTSPKSYFDEVKVLLEQLKLKKKKKKNNKQKRQKNPFEFTLSTRSFCTLFPQNQKTLFANFPPNSTTTTTTTTTCLILNQSWSKLSAKGKVFYSSPLGTNGKLSKKNQQKSSLAESSFFILLLLWLVLFLFP